MSYFLIIVGVVMAACAFANLETIYNNGKLETRGGLLMTAIMLVFPLSFLGAGVFLAVQP